jgi:hypothetical protein
MIQTTQEWLAQDNNIGRDLPGSLGKWIEELSLANYRRYLRSVRRRELHSIMKQADFEASEHAIIGRMNMERA